MTVIKILKRPNSLGFSDVWGWTSPTGREFAYVGEQTGIWFVETTDHNNVKEIGRWKAPANGWRDFTNLGPYVYSSSEGHRGIRVIDMRNPDSPRDLGYIETRSISRAHNISSDPVTNHLYVSGTNQGIVILDASQSRTNPKFVGTYRGAYTHDCCVRNGYAYLANGGGGIWRIMDASSPSVLKQLSLSISTGNYSHNVWVSEDGKLVCHTDEDAGSSGGAPMSIWDVTDKTKPVFRSEFNLQSIVHNVFIIGRTGYMSHYVNGVQIVDMSDATKPHVVASYDTSSVPSGFGGCWGIYPFADSGLIYASDISNGLFVLRQDRGHLNRFGKGVAGGNGRVPRLRFDGSAPRVGGSKLRLEIENLQPNASFFLLVSGGPGQGSLFGVPMHVNLASIIVLQFKADSNGKLTIPAPVPNDQNLVKQRLYLQILGRDAALPGGFSSSRGMWTGIAR